MSLDIFDRLFAGMAMLLLAAVFVPWFAGRRKFAGQLTCLFCLGAALMWGSVGVGVLVDSMPPQHLSIALGGFSLPLLVDGLSALFLVLISVMGVMVSWYSISYMDHYPTYSLAPYTCNLPLFVLGMGGMIVADDLSVGFTLAWQMMTLTSFFLIRFDHRDPAIRRGAAKYLVLMELAWLVIVGGAALAGSLTPGEALGEIAQKIAALDMVHRSLIYGLLLLGFALKAGVFPLGQLWLPDAHSVAPSPISALLSGVMIKTGVYGIIRILFFMLSASEAPENLRVLGLIVAAFGVATLFIGTVQALKQHDAKRLHAYHSIGQMGYIILGLGSALYLLNGQDPAFKMLAVLALIGAVYHTINHAVFKGLLFLCTGSVQYATGTKDLNQLGGLIKLMPATTLAAAVASASIAGIPAFSGFMSKWAIISSGLLAGSAAPAFVFFAIVALMVSAITLASYVKFFGMTFTAAPGPCVRERQPKEVGWGMILPKALLAVACLVQGLLPVIFVTVILRVFACSSGSLVQAAFADILKETALSGSLAGISLSLKGALAAAMPVAVLISLLVALFLARSLAAAGGSRRKAARVWLCGYQQINEHNRFRSADMYAAFKDFMKWTGGNVH